MKTMQVQEPQLTSNRLILLRPLVLHFEAGESCARVYPRGELALVQPHRSSHYFFLLLWNEAYVYRIQGHSFKNYSICIMPETHQQM